MLSVFSFSRKFELRVCFEPGGVCSWKTGRGNIGVKFVVLQFRIITAGFIAPSFVRDDQYTVFKLGYTLKSWLQE